MLKHLKGARVLIDCESGELHMDLGDGQCKPIDDGGSGGGGGNVYTLDPTGTRFYKTYEDMSNDDVVKIVNEWTAGNARIFIYGGNTLNGGGGASLFEVFSITLIAGDSSGNTVDAMASYLLGPAVQQIRIGGNYGSIDSTLFDMAKN